MECCIHALVLQPLGRSHGSVTANPLVLSTTMAAPELLVNLPSPSSPNSNGQLRAPSLFSLSPRISGSNPKRFRVRAIKEKTKEIRNPSSSSSSAEEVTKKYGLEAGLWQIFGSREEDKATEGGSGKKKSKADQAKELLAKYGGAYLATSIILSLISLSLCYALISAGVDVQSLLQKVGISVDETGEKVGTFALAYATHKAASVGSIPYQIPAHSGSPPLLQAGSERKPTRSSSNNRAELSIF